MGKREVLLFGGLLALCLLRTDADPVYAEEQAETKEFEFVMESSSTEVVSELKGTIKVELISVELLAGGFDFNIDPEAAFSPQSPGGQIQSPLIRVANHSVVPVKLEISQVPEIKKEDVVYAPKFGAGPEQSFRLSGKVSETTAPGTAILVLGTAGTTYRSEADFEQYAILPGRTNIPVTELEAHGSRDLKLYGKASADFYGAYQFTVSPTLKISTVNAAD